MNAGDGRCEAFEVWAACRRLLPLFCLLLAVPVLAADSGPDYSKFKPLPPCAGVKTAAQAHQIPLEGFDASGEPGVLHPGDSFTGLVTLCEKGGRRTQWLFYLSALPACPKELVRGAPRPMVLYSGHSNRFEYASAPALVQLRTLGPFAAGASAQDRLKVDDESVTFSLDKDHLGLGLDQAAAAIARIEAHRTTGAAYWFGSAPPGAKEVAETRKFDATLTLTLGEERALGGAIPALFSYAEVVQHIEVLEDIMEKVIQKPSLWSVLGHLGVTVNLKTDSKHIRAANLHSLGWALDTPAYYFPMLLDLNQQLALRATFVVTSPRPPLLSCGGIIGLLAEHPADPETYLTLRVISARCHRGTLSVEALKR